MIPFKSANILLPKNTDMFKWAVIACDQHTSEIDYWNKVKEITKGSISTLDLILPEIYLDDNVEDKINNINKNMIKMYDNHIFNEYENSMIYLKRTLNNGLVREGIIGVIDLENYSYLKDSKSLIRPTEKTIIERVKPRIKIRENALLELPHIMLLIDDESKSIIESLRNEVSENDIVYDSDLMLDGGHVKGYLLNEKSILDVTSKLEKLNNKDYFKKKYGAPSDDVLLFAVGDGNHSLASAKYCYEENKNELSRYALVEIVNLYSEALNFEAIHRVLFNANYDNFIKELNNYYDISDNGSGQKFRVITSKTDKTFYINNPKSNIVVGSVQLFLDEYIKKHNIKIDYIHEEESVKKLCDDELNIGILFEPLKKEELFKTVIVDGVLPRKTFSMGHSNDKRYYLESRKIR